MPGAFPPIGWGDPMMSGVTPNYTGPFNVNIGGLPGAMMGAMAPGMMASAMSGTGLIPAQLLPTQNLMDQFRSNAYFSSSQQAMQLAARQDSETYRNFFRGMSLMTTGTFDARQQQDAYMRARDIAQIMPFAAQMFPDIVDSLHGSRGSATVMAQSLHRAGVHRLDPVTGLRGFSGATTGALSQELFRSMFGPGVDRNAMHGLSAGQAGLLYEQLAIRGLSGPTGGSLGTDKRFRSAAKMHMTTEDFQRMAGRLFTGFDDMSTEQRAEKVAQLRNTHERIRGEVRAADAGGRGVSARDLETLPGADDMLRVNDARRMADRLKNISGAVTAMREIFGDMGHPNAPMAEIMRGLDALTQGGLATMPAGRVEQTVRTIHALSQQSGIGLPAVLGLTAQAGQLTDHLGLTRDFAVQAVMGGLATHTALGDVGRLDLPVFNRGNIDKLTMEDIQSRARAAASGLANQMNATLRLVKEGGVGNGTAAAALATALERGENEFVDPTTGKRRSVNMSPHAWFDLMKRSGVDEFDSEMALQSKQSNMQYGAEFDTASIVQRAQKHGELPRRIAGGPQAVMANFFDKMRVDPRRRGALATMAGSMITQGVMNMNPEDLELGARIEKMRKIVRDSVRQSMISNGMNEAEVERALSGMTDQQWNQMASNAWGSLEQGAHASGQNLRNFVTRNSDKVVNARERAKAAAGGEADVRAKVGGKGAAGLTQRVIDAITNSDGTEDIKTIIARILGGVPASELEGIDAGIAKPPGKGDDAGRKVRDLGREGAKPLEGEVGRDTGKDTGGLRIVGTLTLKGLDEALLSGEVIVPAVDSTPVHP